MADLVGQTLGRYQLIERLGRGGMADIYKGYQPGLDRYVAVKVLHPHLSEDPDFIVRFQREAKAVAALQHPYIIRVFDFDTQDDHDFMVMEYIEGGRTLKEVLQRLSASGERLPLTQALDIAAKLADALDYAHRQGMVHRDIKPSNVLLPSLENPMLSDFGIARIIGQTGLTASGAMIGTPAYMSPEQGRGERADERSDIYALGIVFYEMLTGKPPYDADTPYGVILKHINDPLVPPHDLVGPLPTHIERVVLKSLAKNPDDRYANAGEMRDALREAIRHLEDATEPGHPTEPLDVTEAGAVAEPTVSSPMPDAAETLPMEPAVPLTAPAAAPRRRGGWWVWALVAVFVLAVAGGGLALALGAFGGGAAPPVEIGREGEVEEVPEPVERGEEEGPPAQAGEAGNLVERGYELVWMDETDTAFELFNQALEIDPDNAEALAGRALLHLYEDRVEPAHADLERARELAPDNPRVNLSLALLYDWTEEYYDADAALEALNVAVGGCGDERGLCSFALRQRAGYMMWHVENPDQAFADIERAIELQPNPARIPDLLSERGELHASIGELEPAINDYEEAYELSDGDYWLLEHAAQFAVVMEDYGRATDYYERLTEETAGDPHMLVGRGYIEWRTGNFDAAREFADRALELKPGLLEGHYLLGLALIDLGQPAEALEIMAPVAEQPDTWEYEHPFFIRWLGHEIFYDMARAAQATGDTDWALGLIENSLERESWWAPPYILRAEIYTQRGELAQARENLEQALEIASSDDPGLVELIEQRMRELSEVE